MEKSFFKPWRVPNNWSPDGIVQVIGRYSRYRNTIFWGAASMFFDALPMVSTVSFRCRELLLSGTSLGNSFASWVAGRITFLDGKQRIPSIEMAGAKEHLPGGSLKYQIPVRMFKNRYI